MPTEPDTNYDLVRPDILDQLRVPHWFVDCFNAFFVRVGAQWGCKIECSPARLLDASSLYREDIERTLAFGMDGKQNKAAADLSLDHFKHGAFLVYWLKRSLPINTIDYLDPDGEVIARGVRHKPTEPQQFFSRYGNEYCALLAGFQIVLNYQLQAYQEHRRGSDEEKLAQVRRILESTRLPDRFVHEFPRLLKHKNISPHALYMTFCALFERVADEF